MKKLTIVILSYNVEKLLLECLKSIPSHQDWHIIVVDNASTDNSISSVKKLFPKVEIIQNKKNLGFAAGNNVALRNIESEFTLLLNPDTVITPNSIETVLEYMEKNPNTGAATCRVELADGSLDYSCHRGFPNPINSALHFLGLKKFSSYSSTSISNTIHEIDALTGAFAVVRTKVGKEVGWFDEDYFWNGEDIDLCYKIKEKKWKIIYIPGVKITHYKGASAKATKDTRLAWAKNSTSVMKLFYQKHLAKQYPLIVNILVYGGIWVLQKYRTLKNI